MRVAVIGAGASGLISTKILLENGFDVDVYECNDQIGGTWIYNENTTDKYGLPVTSSMYRDLRTNLPKEIMEFTGFHYDIKNKSYLTAAEVLRYLQAFAEKFHLKSCIKFEHLVKEVSKTEGGWSLTSKDLKTGDEKKKIYEAVFVCIGHYSLPNYPKIEGAKTFKGLCMHSHYYKTPDLFKNKSVLIIGNGPSAQDITFNISPYSEKIFLSHHSGEQVVTPYPENVSLKPDVEMLKGKTVYFSDGSSAEVDAILYCTGYKYDYPFLTGNCGINVSENYVSPLYKHIFSIKHPSMVFIGVPCKSFFFPLIELQAKCAINVLSGKVKLVTEEEMLEDMRSWENYQLSRGYTKGKFHMIFYDAEDYYKELENIGQIEHYPNVLFKIFWKCQESRKRNLGQYRNEVFKIIDCNNFIVE